MKAVRLHEFHQQPVVDEVPEPTISGPLDVIVKIGGAGVCRTDLHIIEGQWDAAHGHPAAVHPGPRERRAGCTRWAPAVTNVAVGDTVILHPTPTCGLCRACRAGDDMHCTENSVVPRPVPRRRDGRVPAHHGPGLRQAGPADPAEGRGRAGRRRHHRLPRGPQGHPAALPGTTAVVIGAGGLGHIGVQCLAALTATTIVVVDRNPDALKLASSSARSTPWSPTAATWRR